MNESEPIVSDIIKIWFAIYEYNIIEQILIYMKTIILHWVYMEY
jgi:hypothetical protein